MSGKLIILALLFVTVFTQGDIVIVEQTPNPTSGEPVSYEIKDGVYILNADTFKSAVAQFDFVLVKLFAPWCGHCKTLAPVWIQLAKSLAAANSQVKIAEVDCTVHQTVCQQNGIRGYPTMLWFQKGKEQSEKYQGVRNIESITNWINERVGVNTQENVAEL